MVCAVAVQSFQGEDDMQHNMHLLPVGKGLVKEDSGPDRGVAHASDSDRATKFTRGVGGGQKRPR